MADMMKCGYDECERAADCLRYTSVGNPYAQSYMAEPKANCADNQFVEYVPNKSN